MSETNRDWDALTAAWQSSRLPQPDADWLRARVRGKRRRMLWAHLLDSIGAVLLIAFAAWLGVRAPEPWIAGWAAVVGVFTLLVLGVVTWNRRDLWQPAATTVRGHLNWCRRRCRRQLRTIAIAWLVFAATTGLVVAALGFSGHVLDEGRIAFMAGFLALFAAGLGLWSAWYARALRRELARIERLAREFADAV